MKIGKIQRTPVVLVGLLVATGLFAEVAAAQRQPTLASALASPTAILTEEVTFTADIAPILQENCQTCHRPGGVGPMSFLTYEEVRPWAGVMKYRTGLRDRAGVMPPYYLERGIGIQHMQEDWRLTEEDIQKIASWADNGAPLGKPEDMPPPRIFNDSGAWALGEPDLITKTEEFFMEAGAPDWWGEMPSVPVGLTEDRYVRAVAIREVNTVVGEAADETSVGGRWIVHHMIWSTRVLNDSTASGGDDDDEDDDSTGWPVHELARNPDIFDPRAGRILRAGSSVVSNSVHLHSSGRDSKAHLEIGWYLHPVGYKPEYRSGGLSIGDGMNIDIRGNTEGYQELHAYTVLNSHVKITTFEPHLHGPGARMCVQAIWGSQIETLNCAGYDHNWVRQYTYAEGYEPLLPKGTIVHLIGYMDMSVNSPNVPDPRNWQGSGNRSITNMFINLGQEVSLTDAQFVQEMADRRERLGLDVNDHVLGCPLCMANIPLFPPEPDEEASPDGVPSSPQATAPEQGATRSGGDAPAPQAQ